MRKLTSLFILFMLGILAFGWNDAPVVAAGDFKLTLLHTSENHGHWETMTFSNVSQGGIARRATLVKKLRAEIPNTLLLDSGDVSQGTLYYLPYQGKEGRDFYNLLGYDAVTMGNHEFDLGPKVLADNFVNGANFSIVLANVDVSNEPTLAGKIPPFVVKTVGGEKIGIFGMVTDELPTNSRAGPNVKMKDAAQTVKDVVTQLNSQGVNKIILLSHRGYDEDKKLASQVDGIDVIVSGHTVTLLGDPAKLDKSLGAPDGPYPTMVNNPGGGRTAIVHDYLWGRQLGRLDLTFDDQGVLQSASGDPILVDKNIADDPVVAQKLTELAAPLASLKTQKVGNTTVDLEGDARVVRNKESNLGDLIADAMLFSTTNDKTQIALMNGGGIRASVKAGDVTNADVLLVLPFGNRLVQFDVTGADLLAALENGVSQVNADPGQSGGRFPQVGGLKFSADLSKPVSSRITDVQIGSAQSGFKPLDKAATYRVVTNDFVAAGLDGYTVLKNAKNVKGGDVPLDQSLREYFQAKSPLNPRVEGRITITGSPPASATSVVTGTVTATKLVTATVAPTPTKVATPSTSPTSGAEYPTMDWVLLSIGLVLLGGGVMLINLRRA